MILRTTAAIITAALLLSGCVDYLPQAPVPESIAPPTAPENTQTAVTITGRNFFPGVKVSYTDKSHSILDTSFSARLGDTQLIEVTYVDSGTLTATVPATLSPGIYDLVVSDPTDRIGKLDDAFTVTSTTVCPRDVDLDGFVDAACPNGDDCNDSDINIHPGADDSDCDNVDDDCDTNTDGDYVPTPTNCGTGVCAATGQLECQSGSEVDTCTAGSPTEDPETTCDDNLDNDCDGSTDLGDSDCTPTCTDNDTDGYGSPGDPSCPNGSAEDCDDDPLGCGNACYPGNPQPDGCDGYDNDCDTFIDEDSDMTFSYRNKITILDSQVEGTANYADFPVLVSLIDDNLKHVDNAGHVANPDGWDIILRADSAAVCNEPAPCDLDHEIESYDPVTGTLVSWVRVPILFWDAPTEIYIHYGNDCITAAQERPASVWVGNYAGVWHMKEEVAGTGTLDAYEDSTSYGNHGDDQISATGQTGKIGAGQEFDGVDDFIDCGADSSLDITQEITMSAWIYMTEVPRNNEWYMLHWKGESYSTYISSLNNPLTTLGMYFVIDGRRFDIWDWPDIDIFPNEWTHIAVTFDGAPLP